MSQAEDGIRVDLVTGVQTCALPILAAHWNVVRSVGHETVARDKTIRTRLGAGTELVVERSTEARICIHAAGDLIEQRVRGAENQARSEERRVGKEGRTRGETDESSRRRHTS